MECAEAFSRFAKSQLSFVKAGATSLQLRVDELQWLRGQSVGRYVNESGAVELADGQRLSNRALSRLDRDRLERDLKRIFVLRSELEGLPLTDFRSWWSEYRDAILMTHPLLMGSARNDLSLGSLTESLWMTFLLSSAQSSNRGWLKRQLQHIHPRYWGHWSWALTKGVTRWSLRNTQTLLIVGPLATIFGSWIWIVVGPTARFAEQDGAERFKDVAAKANDWLTSKDKIDLESQKISILTDELQRFEFSGLTPEASLQKWQEFEEAYYDVFSRFSRTLPAHLRDGRSLYRELVISAPLTLAAQLATFDIQYWTHRRALDELKPDQPHFESLRQLHTSRMESAESSMAAVLAAWKLTEFLYPEVARQKNNQAARNSLQDGFLKFAKQLRFETYQKEYVSQVQTFLKEVNFDLKVLTQARDELGNKTASPLNLPVDIGRPPEPASQPSRSPNSSALPPLPGEPVYFWQGQYRKFF